MPEFSNPYYRKQYPGPELPDPRTLRAKWDRETHEDLEEFAKGMAA